MNHYILLQNPQADVLILVFHMGLKYRDKYGKWTIDFRCNKNNHALCWPSTATFAHSLHLCSVELASG